MKRVVLGVVGIVLMTGPMPGWAQKISINKNNRTIAVTVTDKAMEPADVATVHIGFKAYGPDADSAYAAGSKVSNAVIDALKKAGVPDKAIESQTQNLQQNYQFDSKEGELERAQKRYVLSQSWTVKTSAADASKVLHIAVEAGANDSGQIDWDVKDHAALQAAAAAKALKHARAIAEQMAKGLDAELGSLLYASNTAPETPIAGGLMGALGRAAQFNAVQPLAIRPQVIEEDATVYAVFGIQ
jgi:uncharacterized protein YggE